MRITIILLIFALSSWTLQAATEEASFEKSFQQLGKKLDEAKSKGKELTAEAKEELKNLQAKGEQASREAAEQSKAKREDWSQRVSSAFDEFKLGATNAWRKLKGEK